MCWGLPGFKRHERDLPMCSDFAVRIKGLGKSYHIYRQPYDRLLQMVMRGWKQLYSEFWALKNVSFDVKIGETIGVIGRNGSGKSTLLQMLCGTLNPTTGDIETNGRIASLLELGAGFNPEFTGRENVYMSGALYGLTRKEIDERFERIVSFADIGDFIEQPVRMYSSGMFVRLGFAVIANIDADILVIDEALAVGDVVFVQKCMRFLRQFRGRGTLIFVSHDMSSIINFCDKVIWLHEGSIEQIGAAKEVTNSYLRYSLQEAYGRETELVPFENSKSSPESVLSGGGEGSKHCSEVFYYESTMNVQDNILASGGWSTGLGEIISVQFEQMMSSGKGATVLTGGETVRLIIKAIARSSMKQPILGFLVRDRLGQDLFGENTLPFTEKYPQPVKSGTVIEGEFVFRLPMLPNGQYSVMASYADGDLNSHVQHHWLHDALIITVSSSRVRWGLVGVQFDRVGLREIE